MGMSLTHLDAKGRAVMVDVSAKAETERLAVAKGRIIMHPATLRLVLGKNVKKGDVLTVAQLAGIAGVEMEALTAVTIAALTVYDMCKAVDRDMVLSDIRLEHKSGGKSGVYER